MNLNSFLSIQVKFVMQALNIHYLSHKKEYMEQAKIKKGN